jgi:hypothetical protein
MNTDQKKINQKERGLQAASSQELQVACGASTDSAMRTLLRRKRRAPYPCASVSIRG